jgi:hypothetical protein
MGNASPLLSRVRRSVRRLLAAIDRALAAAREVERARDALAREAGHLRPLRVHCPEDEHASQDAP